MIDKTLQIKDIKYNIDGIKNIVSVYQEIEYCGNFFLERIHNEGAVLLYKKPKDKSYVFFTILISILAFFLFFILRNKEMIVKKDLFFEGKGYKIYQGMIGSDNVLAKYLKNKDIRFANEIEILKNNQRCNIIRYILKQEKRKEKIIVMENCSKLEKNLNKIEIFDIVKAVHFLHKNNTVHNNICIQNILRNNSGFVVLANFEDASILQKNNTKIQEINVLNEEKEPKHFSKDSTGERFLDHKNNFLSEETKANDIKKNYNSRYLNNSIDYKTKNSNEEKKNFKKKENVKDNININNNTSISKNENNFYQILDDKSTEKKDDKEIIKNNETINLININEISDFQKKCRINQERKKDSKLFSITKFYNFILNKFVKKSKKNLSYNDKNSEIGTLNWRSAEIIQKNHNVIELTNEMKLKADVFSLGILLHMNYAKNHPYDLGGSIEKNILKGVFRLSFIADGTLLDLITNCIKYNYKERLSIDDVVNHVYFWSNEKKFNFLANLSDFLEFKSEESKKVNNRLERNKKKVFINKWNNYIDQEVIEEMQEHRYYNFTYMKELLRVIRNKGRHFKEMPENIKKYYVSFPDGYVNYYLERFPHLLSTCHYSAKIACNEEMLRNFYYNHIN